MMSVISSVLMLNGRSGSSDHKYRRIYKASYRVKTSSSSNGWLTVLSQSGAAGLEDPVPNLWSTYALKGEVDGNVFLQDKAGILENPGSETTWVVDVVWRQPEPGSDPAQDSQPNPLNRAVRYHIEWANYSKVVDKDNIGNAVTNAAGQEFDPPLEQDDARPVLVAVRNEWPLGSIIGRSLDYKNAVNTDTFYGAPPRQAKMESILSSELMIENGVSFYSVVYRIQFNDIQWDIEPVNQGFMYYENATDKNLKVARERNTSGVDLATPVSEPIGLNHDGTRRDDNAVPPKIFVQTPFRVYPERSFAALGL